MKNDDDMLTIDLIDYSMVYNIAAIRVNNAGSMDVIRLEILEGPYATHVLSDGESMPSAPVDIADPSTVDIAGPADVSMHET